MNNLKSFIEYLNESKYTIYSTKEDYEKAYKELRELDVENKLDWKKIKTMSLDSVHTLIGVVKRKPITESGIWKDKWDKGDLTLAFYHSIYGTRGLSMTSRELAETVIGSSLGSLKKQGYNFDYLRGLPGLGRPHKIETEVFKEYKDLSQNDFRKVCLDIIDKKGNTSGKNYIETFKKRQMKNDLDAELIKKGFDPKKMKSLGTRPTLQSMLEDEPVQETKKYGKCQHCTKKKKNIGRRRINPYDDDVRSMIHKEYICDDCYQMLINDI